jgi:hypothetical protein
LLPVAAAWIAPGSESVPGSEVSHDAAVSFVTKMNNPLSPVDNFSDFVVLDGSSSGLQYSAVFNTIFSDENPLLSFSLSVEVALLRDSSHKNLLSQSTPAFTVANIKLHIKACVSFVEKKFTDPNFRKFVALYKLEREGIAAIVLYTRECGFFSALNRALRSQDDGAIHCFAPFLRLVLTALSKLPCYEGDLVFRGVRGDFGANYRKGAQFIEWAFSSYTTDISVLQNGQFFGHVGERVLFQINSLKSLLKSHVEISMFSQFPNEREVLQVPGFTWQVKQVQNSGIIAYLRAAYLCFSVVLKLLVK